MYGYNANAFANTSSSILISKVQGNIVDVLMPPLSEYELTFLLFTRWSNKRTAGWFISIYDNFIS